MAYLLWHSLGLGLFSFSFYCRICQISKVFAFMYFILKTMITAVGPEAKEQKKL